MSLYQYFAVAIILVFCFSGLHGLALEKLPLANPIPISASQLATFTPNVRSEVLALITNSLASAQAFPSYTSLINSNAPLVAASPLNISPGTGYLTALSQLRSKVVQVRKPALINPYPVAPFPYITAADVAAAQLISPTATIPQIQQAVIDSKKKKKVNQTAPAINTQISTQQIAQQQPIGGSYNLQVRPVEQAETHGNQIANIIQNALQMVQNSPEFMNSLQTHNPAALGNGIQQAYANSLDDQLTNGLQISLYHGPQSQYSPNNMDNHQYVILQPQNNNYQQIVPTSISQDISHDHLNGMEGQIHSHMMSPNLQFLSGY